jgi:hypothetical protein
MSATSASKASFRPGISISRKPRSGGEGVEPGQGHRQPVELREAQAAALVVAHRVAELRPNPGQRVRLRQVQPVLQGHDPAEDRLALRLGQVPAPLVVVPIHEPHQLGLPNLVRVGGRCGGRQGEGDGRGGQRHPA